MQWAKIPEIKPRNNISHCRRWHSCRRCCILGSRILQQTLHEDVMFPTSQDWMLACEPLWCINVGNVDTYKHIYIQNIYNGYKNLSTVFIVHCRDSYKPRSSFCFLGFKILHQAVKKWACQQIWTKPQVIKRNIMFSLLWAWSFEFKVWEWCTMKCLNMYIYNPDVTNCLGAIIKGQESSAAGSLSASGEPRRTIS